LFFKDKDFEVALYPDCPQGAIFWSFIVIVKPSGNVPREKKCRGIDVDIDVESHGDVGD
jgi:hypothetical protein